MTRARRLHRSARLTPGADARHRRQPGIRRRHAARPAVPPLPPCEPELEIPVAAPWPEDPALDPPAEEAPWPWPEADPDQPATPGGPE